MAHLVKTPGKNKHISSRDEILLTPTSGGRSFAKQAAFSIIPSLGWAGTHRAPNPSPLEPNGEGRSFEVTKLRQESNGPSHVDQDSYNRPIIRGLFPAKSGLNPHQRGTPPDRNQPGL